MGETEKKNIQDAEIGPVDQEEIIKKNYRTEIVLIFVIGLLIGVMIKSEALKRISVGFEDYKVVAKTQGYDIEAIERNLFKEAEEAQKAESESVEGEADEVIIDDSVETEE